jgi:beta-lysine 5,6-aminomutase alpha subunit
VIGLENVNYVFASARDLGEEIEFKRGGIVQRRAQEVLRGAHELLQQVAEEGLFSALARGVFGDVPRGLEQGRGLEGVVDVGEDYFNPVGELMRGASSVA